MITPDASEVRTQSLVREYRELHVRIALSTSLNHDDHNRLYEVVEELRRRNILD